MERTPQKARYRNSSSIFAWKVTTAYPFGTVYLEGNNGFKLGILGIPEGLQFSTWPFEEFLIASFFCCSILWSVSKGVGKTAFQRGGTIKFLLPRKYRATEIKLASGQSDQACPSKAIGPFAQMLLVPASGRPSPCAISFGKRRRICSAKARGYTLGGTGIKKSWLGKQNMYIIYIYNI